MADSIETESLTQRWDELLDKGERQELIEELVEDSFNREHNLRPRSPAEIKQAQQRLQELNDKKLPSKDGASTPP